MPFGVALFLLFSGLARYWSYRYAGPPARLATQALPSRRRAEILGVVLAVTVAAGAALVVRAYVRPYRVLSPSMLPTLEQDDLIAGRMRPHTSVNSSTPSRGDVVVFHGSAVSSKLGGARVPEILVKRVVGLPGDLIEMRGDVPVINGWTVPTCDAGEYLYVMPDVTGQALRGRLRIEFLDDRAYLTVHAVGRPFVGAYRVKPGEVFVLGDNRGNSMDSRAYSYGHGGGVPLDAIEARVQWFLVGTQRTGDADFGRLLRPIDGLRAPLPLDGVQGLQRPPSEEGITRCLRNRPADTRAPLPDHVP
jgi:signal peptidase I